MSAAGRRNRWILARAACCLALAACATAKPAPKQNTFALLAEPEGGAGQISVVSASGTQVLSQPGQATVVVVDKPPSQPVVLDEAEISRTFGDALAAMPVAPVHFILYFKEDSDDLTPESQALLPDFFRAVREHDPADVSIVGHTDTRADRDYNYKLGLRRANRLADLLAAQGVDRSTLDIDSHGKDDLLIKTGDQVPEPRNRRVEITVR